MIFGSRGGGGGGGGITQGAIILGDLGAELEEYG